MAWVEASHSTVTSDQANWPSTDSCGGAESGPPMRCSPARRVLAQPSSLTPNGAMVDSLPIDDDRELLVSIRDVWPLIGLCVEAPGEVVLEYPDEALLVELSEVLRQEIHPAGEMPFARPWSAAPPAERARAGVAYHWKCRGQWHPDDWTCPFVVRVRGEVVGTQEIMAESFAVTGEVSSGSWLTKGVHGRGIGTRMREAMLAFAFHHLGARGARTHAWDDNHASHRISQKLGYRPNGVEIEPRAGQPVPLHRYRMTTQDWRAEERPEVRVSGFDGLLGWFDSTQPGWPGTATSTGG